MDILISKTQNKNSPKSSTTMTQYNQLKSPILVTSVWVHFCIVKIILGHFFSPSTLINKKFVLYVLFSVRDVIETVHFQEFCRKGMKCSDQFCRCSSFDNHLIDPHSQACVEKRTTDATNDFQRATQATSLSPSVTAIIVLACLISVLMIILAVSMFVQGYKGMCDRGQYECDEEERDKRAKSGGGRVGGPGQPRFGNTVHVAAWDLPGLDYLSEEQTMKYLNRGGQQTPDEPPVETSTPNGQPLRRMGGTQHIDQAGGSSAGSSPSPSGTSLPESDRFDGTQRDATVSRRADGGGHGKSIVNKSNSIETVQSHIL